ncbi:unnamed protein product [Prorocentrum cordatum]|uniref:Na(+)/H(+) antiporter NhaA n=1 Tax=Prorocentrum cordatum TaxID=2364126 RepID=A0ABN9WJV6_9DINO|nr:unnamed protein product [Polarella glacialis]
MAMAPLPQPGWLKPWRLQQERSMDPGPGLPGSVDCEIVSEIPRPNPPPVHRRRGEGLHVRLWEYGGTIWTESHIYSHWLEADCSNNGDDLDVHLPSVSVQGLMQLRRCLDHPGALCLDPPSDGGTEDAFLWGNLCSRLDEPASVEAQRALSKRRGPCNAQQAAPPQPKSQALEMMQPEVGAECMDVSICALEGLQEDSAPVMMLLRCERPLASLRYAALVACASAGGAQALHAAREVAKALATAFLDERFVREASRAPRHQPSRVVEAFDSFLSMLTIVPTVHLRSKESGTASLPLANLKSNEASTGDVLLSDSLQHQMESLLCKSLGVTPPSRTCSSKGMAEDERVKSHWKRCFVQVDCLDSATQEWKTTHQLRQGMEIDAGSGKKPHLPHASAAGLSKIRGLIAPHSVALNVTASSGTAAAALVAQQLGRAGLPPGAAEAVASALRDRATRGASPPELAEPDSPTKACTPFVMEGGHEWDLVAPCEEDDSFLILLVSSEEVPSSTGIASACLRFSNPVEFAQCETVVRFLVVLVGPVGAADEISQIGNSLAALAVDEDLVGSLDKAVDGVSFSAAMHRRLNDIPVMPRSRLQGHGHHHELGAQNPPESSPRGSPTESPRSTAKGKKSSKATGDEQEFQEHSADRMHERDPATMSLCRRMWFYARPLRHAIQKYSLPLVCGVLLALTWVNVDEHSYHTAIHGYFSDDLSIFGHKVSLHFIVNDIFMCFFFGLAIKEVTEALLPGGSLSPLRRAANPLCATLGGIIGPIVCYFIMTLMLDAFGAFDGEECQVEVEGRRLAGGSSGGQFTGEVAPCKLQAILNGWGVPTATDISLAWMFALLIFGPGHPAINFLLLLAIVDDAIGMVIIAVFYGDKDKPFYEGKEWLGLVVCAAILAYILRRLRVQQWPVFILVCGPVSWIGLLKAHVHPALALVAVVPFMPATHAIKKQGSDKKGLGAGVDWSSRSSTRVLKGMLLKAAPLAQYLSKSTRGNTVVGNMMQLLQNQEDAPLHLFEHHLKLPVDIGMFFFGLANAGVKLGSVGNVTTCVLTALIVGKTLGVAGFAMFAQCLGFGLPAGITIGDLFSMGALAGVGLTVALFVSNEAFTDPGLQGQAKMGALLSIGSAGCSWLIKAVHRRLSTGSLDETSDNVMALGDSDDEDLERTRSGLEEEGEGFEDVITQELMEKMWEFRRYKARGHHLNIDHMARSVTRKVSRNPTASRTPKIATPSSRDDDGIKHSTSESRLGQFRLELPRSTKKHATCDGMLR